MTMNCKTISNETIIQKSLLIRDFFGLRSCVDQIQNDKRTLFGTCSAMHMKEMLPHDNA